MIKIFLITALLFSNNFGFGAAIEGPEPGRVFEEYQEAEKHARDQASKHQHIGTACLALSTGLVVHDRLTNSLRPLGAWALANLAIAGLKSYPAAGLWDSTADSYHTWLEHYNCSRRQQTDKNLGLGTLTLSLVKLDESETVRSFWPSAFNRVVRSCGLAVTAALVAGTLPTRGIWGTAPLAAAATWGILYDPAPRARAESAKSRSLYGIQLSN